MKPVGDYIFFKKAPKSDIVSSSGIVMISDYEEEKASTGTIEAFGPDVEGLTIGDSVLFNEHQCDKLTKDLLVGKKSSIYALC